MEIYIGVILSFILSLISGLVVIPLIIKFCIKHRLFDQPNMRKVHTTAIPRLGGICFFPIALIALVMALVFVNITRVDNTTLTLSVWTLNFFISLLTIYVLGFLDDILGLDAKIKFAVQTLAASLLPLSGLYLHSFEGLFGIGEVHWLVGALLSILIVVYICNAINLIDGIDGLAGCLSIIAFGGFLVMFMAHGLIVYSALIAAMIGVLTAYVRFNLFGSEQHRTKIFMGDAGSLSIGFTLAFLFLKNTAPFPTGNLTEPEQLVMTCSLFVVPAFDVLRVSVARIRHRLSIFTADKNHIHHKLMRAGLNQHQALIAIIAFAIAVVAVDALIVSLVNPNIVLLLDIIMWILYNFIIDKTIQKLGGESFLLPNQ